MAGIGVLGNIVADNIKHIARYPNSGMLENITAIERHIGGCVANTICDLAIIDPALRLEAFGVVGDDAEGSRAIELMQSYGVNTAGVRRHPALQTSFTDCFCEATGERTFFHYRGSNAALCAEDIDAAALSLRHMHVGYLLLLDGLDRPDESYGTKSAALLAALQRAGLTTSLDIVSENSDRYKSLVVPALRYTDYAIFNELEAAAVCGVEIRRGDALLLESMPGLLARLLELGVAKMAIVHCPEGGFAMDSAGRYYAQGSYELKRDSIAGTVGAGDAFCAGALYGIDQRMDTDSMLRFASAAAAFNLRAVDSISGMGPRAEIERFMANTKQRGL